MQEEQEELKESEVIKALRESYEKKLQEKEEIIKDKDKTIKDLITETKEEKQEQEQEEKQLTMEDFVKGASNSIIQKLKNRYNGL